MQNEQLQSLPEYANTSYSNRVEFKPLNFVFILIISYHAGLDLLNGSSLRLPD
jgi:hypothetical protein